MRLSSTSSLLPFLLFPVLVMAEEYASPCLQYAASLLAKNAPEFVLIPDADAANSFTRTRISVSIEWQHIDALLDKSCVRSYLLEYRQFHDSSSPTSKRLSNRSKRESVAGLSQISPLLPGNSSSYILLLPDDCHVYSVRLAVQVSPSEVDDSRRGELLYSQSRQFWPAAHRTNLEVFSDGLVVSWPPKCQHVTKGWQLVTCRDTGDEDDADRCVSRLDLHGESPIHVTPLPSCSSFHVRLIGPASMATSTSLSSSPSQSPAPVVLWSFTEVRTLPSPELYTQNSRTSLRLRIRQGHCDASAYVRHWRVTYCVHAPSDDLNSAVVNSDDDDEEDNGEEGSGLEQEQEQDSYYYYYDSSDSSSSSQSCVNTVHHLSPSAGDGETISLESLEQCTLYSIDVLPTDSNGNTLQPGEQYGTIHSTLCGDDDGVDAKTPTKSTSSSENDAFWFSGDSTAQHADLANTSSGDGDGDGDGGGNIADSTAPLVLVCLLALSAGLSTVVWLAWRRLDRRRSRRDDEAEALDKKLMQLEQDAPNTCHVSTSKMALLMNK